MATAWNGADPTEVVDGGDYELGVAYRCDADLTISAIRIHTGAGENNFTNRRGRIWSAGGGQLALITMPDDPVTGWSVHALDAPLEINAGTTIVISYSTGGDYSALDAALHSSVPSADGQVVALAAALAPNGRNGSFNTTPGSFPAAGVDGHPFYGCDFVYTLGHGDNTAPTLSAVAIARAGATITATATVSDAETLVGATLRFEWGDGSPDTTVNWPTVAAQHTYTASGDYAVLVTVTDVGGLTDSRAVVAAVPVPVPGQQLSEGPVQAAIFAVLNGDPQLALLVNGVGDGPPESAGGSFDVADLPYVDLGDMLSMQDNAHGEFGREIVHTVHVWARGYSTLPGYTITARVAALLDHQVDAVNAVLSMPHRVVSIRLEYEQALRDPKPDIRHHVMRFRIHTTVVA